jgi:tRNA(fMet)-specific endonuclease VapC
VPRYLLDTNTCIAAMRSHPKAIQRMAAVPPGECAISTVTAYELFTGVEKCSKPAQERAKVDLLLRTVHELAFESAAARETVFGRCWNPEANPSVLTIYYWLVRLWQAR